MTSSGVEPGRPALGHLERRAGGAGPPRGVAVGVGLARFTEYVTARSCTPVEAAALQLHAGAPVLVVTRVAFTTGGRAVEVNDMVLPGESHELVYELPADS